MAPLEMDGRSQGVPKVAVGCRVQGCAFLGTICMSFPGGRDIWSVVGTWMDFCLAH